MTRTALTILLKGLRFSSSIQHMTVDGSRDAVYIRGPIIRGEPRYTVVAELFIEEHITS